MKIQTIKEEIRKLSRREQAEIMHFMIELLAGDDLILSEAWRKELEKREKSLDNDRSIGKPFKDILLKYKGKG